MWPTIEWMRTLSVIVVFVAIMVGCPSATQSRAATLWFTGRVGDATQVVAVRGMGGYHAELAAWQRTAHGWRGVLGPDESLIGADGVGARADDTIPWTPAGVFTLGPFFGTLPAPSGIHLPYLVVGPNDWWDVDSHSPDYNTHQVCARQACRFNTAVSENLTAYPYAIEMGVNPRRTPYGGAAYFVHLTSGGPSAGCVTLERPDLLALMRWLRPGALIAIQ
jgi:L,D-peptidoglycan transpeptidase YkuD (ErfK/YbiS/YcfS/YnhG family)